MRDGTAVIVMLMMPLILRRHRHGDQRIRLRRLVSTYVRRGPTSVLWRQPRVMPFGPLRVPLPN